MQRLNDRESSFRTKELIFEVSKKLRFNCFTAAWASLSVLVLTFAAANKPHLTSLALRVLRNCHLFLASSLPSRLPHHATSIEQLG